MNVKEYLQKFVLARIYTYRNRELAGRFGVRSVPAIFVLDAEGNRVGSFTGYKDAQSFIKAVEEVLTK